jgi:hypothetical protein
MSHNNTDSDSAVQAALSGSQPEAPGKAAGYLFVFSFCNVLCLQPFRACGHCEGNRFAFSQCAKAIHLNCRMVNEYITAGTSFNKSVTLGVIEPLYFARLFIHDNPAPVPQIQFARSDAASRNEKAALLLAAVTRSGQRYTTNQVFSMSIRIYEIQEASCKASRMPEG